MDMRSQWVNSMRAGVAVAVLVSAAVHLYIYAQGFSGIPVIGPLFLANVIGGVVIAAAVGFWRHWIPPVLAAGFGLTTLAAYWVSVIHGLFGVREVTGGWPEIVAEAAEYTAVVLGATVAIILWRQANSRRARTPARNCARTRAGRLRSRGAAGPRKSPITAGRTVPTAGVPDDPTRYTPLKGRIGR